MTRQDAILEILVFYESEDRDGSWMTYAKTILAALGVNESEVDGIWKNR